MITAADLRRHPPPALSSPDGLSAHAYAAKSTCRFCRRPTTVGKIVYSPPGLDVRESEWLLAGVLMHLNARARTPCQQCRDNRGNQ